MPAAEILIVGGGAAGLSAAGALKKAGLETVILDKEARVGDVWRQRYQRLHLHTIRPFSGLAHFPIPARFGKYLHKDRYAEYLEEYARHFDLQLVPDTRVRKLALGSESGAQSFSVETDQETWRARVLVVATGHFGAPCLPDWPGMDSYRGRLLHSEKYRTGQEFSGQRVLVIGSGNSGAEIAADLAEQGAATAAISIRTPPPVVPRDVLGMPVQAFGIMLSVLPPGLADRIGGTIARLATGDLSPYGLHPPAWQPFSARRIPVIDVGFIEGLKAGCILVRPEVGRFREGGVVFVDGRQEAFDVVVAATGFKPGLDRLVQIPGVLDENALPKSPSGRPSSQPGLYFIGVLHSHRGHLFEINRHSRRLASSILNDFHPA